MDEKQYQALVEKVGKDAADKIAAEMATYKTTMEAMFKGALTQEKLDEAKAQIEASVNEVREIARKQGTTLNEILDKLDGNDGAVVKSIGEVLKADEAELMEVFKSGNRRKEYMISVNSKGQIVMRPFDTVKAAGPHATIADVGGNGNVPSISQSIDSTTLLRLGADAPIVSQFRNTPWIFDLCNTVNVGFGINHFMWIDEQAKDGASANVAEGGTKPLVQYKYDVKTDTYKKEAMLVQFTEEFSLDFARLQDDIMRVARIDLINRINAAILPRITTAATTFNIGASYAPDGIDNVNDWDVLAAMAAQVENSTFSNMTNGAVMSTFKKYRLGTQKDVEGRWLDRPSILSNMAIVSNPGQAADAVMVGDFKQYNIALRGGIIVRVGYNGTDFAENRFSTVVEQYYYDYISTIRKAAIVKGATFADVKAAIEAGS